MAYTRADIESVLVQRVGGVFIAAGMDGTTISGSNASLNDPIGYALRQLGYNVAYIASVSDADLAGVPGSEIDALLDLAELRALNNFIGMYSAVDIRLGPRSENLSQLAAQVGKRVEALEKSIASNYGLLSSAEFGTLTLDFAEHYDDQEER